MYRAVIFYFDGTIIDTEQHIFETINRHLKEVGAELISTEFYRQTIGGSDDVLKDYLNQVVGQEGTERVYQDVHESSTELEIFPEIHSLMKQLKQRHIPMAIATSSYRRDIQPAFDQLGLEDYIEVIIGKEDVDEVKPSPELYLRAVQALNYNPVNCLAIEDSTNGAEAATLAGLDVIVQTNQMTSAHDFSSFNYVGKDMSADDIIQHYFTKE